MSVYQHLTGQWSTWNPSRVAHPRVPIYTVTRRRYFTRVLSEHPRCRWYQCNLCHFINIWRVSGAPGIPAGLPIPECPSILLPEGVTLPACYLSTRAAVGTSVTCVASSTGRCSSWWSSRVAHPRVPIYTVTRMRYFTRVLSEHSRCRWYQCNLCRFLNRSMQQLVIQPGCPSPGAYLYCHPNALLYPRVIWALALPLVPV